MKGITWALIIFLVMFAGDLVSTLAIGSTLIHYLEANPLYQYLGLAGIAVLNLGVAGAFYYGYEYSKRAYTRHAFMFTLVLVSVLRVFIIYSNVQVALNPPTLAQAQTVTAAAKQAHYWVKVVSPLIMAALPASLTFLLFNKDHTIEVKK